MFTFDLASSPPETEQMRDDEAALEPPPGVKSNFKHPRNLDAMVYFVIIMSLLLSTTFFILCAYRKWYLQKRIRANDCYLTGWLLILTRKFFHGLFVHQWDIQNKHLDEVLFSTFVFAYLYIIINGILKTAILWEWTRPFRRRSRKRDISYSACPALLFFNVILLVVSLVLLSTHCTPLKRAWDRRVTGKCRANNKPYDMSTAIINVVLDTAIALLPQINIWEKWSAHHQDVVHALTFGTSLSAFVMGLGRILYIVRYNESKDDTYESSAVALWSLAELTCGFMTYTMNGAYSAIHRMLYGPGLEGDGNSDSEDFVQDVAGANQDPYDNPPQYVPRNPYLRLFPPGMPT
ncbi:hypothetical protein F5Y03DRAFT_392382 [Xylaria venustula]|nr:hypothetical protein F5Y03DRAFT_392382 [Xylaria venustula]